LTDTTTLVIVAPVLIATLMRGALAAPVGADVWRDDWLPVPGEPGRQLRDLFTGQTWTAESIDGRAALRLRDVFGVLPVSALLAD
jgi:maltooligosyltrehalose synthase